MTRPLGSISIFRPNPVFRGDETPLQRYSNRGKRGKINNSFSRVKRALFRERSISDFPSVACFPPLLMHLTGDNRKTIITCTVIGCFRRRVSFGFLERADTDFSSYGRRLILAFSRFFFLSFFNNRSKFVKLCSLEFLSI